MKDFFRNFFGNPVFTSLTAVLTILAVAFVNPPDKKPSDVTTARLNALQNRPVIANAPAESKITVPLNTVTTAGTLTTTETDVKPKYEITAETATQTESPETTTATETVTTTSEPHEYFYDYISAGESPNSSYYQDRLTIIGDSIAYGFNAYGYIPYEHNIARESLAVWNMDSYYFDMDGYSMGIIDSADYVNTPLYFISMGMNDIYGCTADQYGASILSIAQQVLERVPTAIVIAGGITPVADWNSYTTNDTIRSFNYSLQTAVESAGNPQILFFDTYSVLADPYTLALSDDHSGGDGMHLSGYSYSYILNCLFNFLDSQNVMKQIQIHDTTAY